MEKLLFIGSVVADVVMRVPMLPRTGEDVNLLGQQVSLGGCAYNAFHTARLTSAADCTLMAPVGTGLWGDWVRRALTDRDVVSAAPPVNTPNGCCYCLVEPDGERTFLCEHGAEYFFRKEWFENLPAFDGVYLCGLEVEESTGDVLLDYLEACPPKRLYFAPGPRLCHIPPAKMARIMAMAPVFHLNEVEAMQFTRTDEAAEAAALIRHLTQTDVIVTLGARGTYVLGENGGRYIPAEAAQVVDAIGAGDAHIGALMGAMAEGVSLEEAAARANRVAAMVVSQAGAELSPKAWKKAEEERNDER